MKYGYARVSTDDQNTALQLVALKQAGCKTKAIFKDEGISGATTKRPALLRCLSKLKQGDTLIVWKLVNTDWTGWPTICAAATCPLLRKLATSSRPRSF